MQLLHASVATSRVPVFIYTPVLTTCFHSTYGIREAAIVAAGPGTTRDVVEVAVDIAGYRW